MTEQDEKDALDRKMKEHGLYEGPCSEEEEEVVETEEEKKERKAREKEERKKKKARFEKAMKENESIEFKRKCMNFVCLFFMFAGGGATVFGTIYSATMGDGVVRLDVNNIAEVKDVLFGGDPWLIYCVDNQTANYPVPAVLGASAWDLRSTIGVKVGVLDCFQTLDSGRSIAQKFGFGHNPGMSFAIANGEKPRQVNLVGVHKSEELERMIKPALSVQSVKIDTIGKWPKCSGRRACVMIGHKTAEAREKALNVFKPLLDNHRGVKVVTLDTSFWALKLGDAVLKRRPKINTMEAVDVMCIARPEGHTDRGPNETHSGTFLQKALDASSASSFMTACDKHQDLVVWGVEPKIAAKTKKKAKPKEAKPSSPTKDQKAPPKQEKSPPKDQKAPPKDKPKMPDPEPEEEEPEEEFDDSDAEEVEL